LDCYLYCYYCPHSDYCYHSLPYEISLLFNGNKSLPLLSGTKSDYILYFSISLCLVCENIA
jgi:hypothetical protein